MSRTRQPQPRSLSQIAGRLAPSGRTRLPVQKADIGHHWDEQIGTMFEG